MNSIYSADLGNGTFQNPLLFGNYADPSIVRDGCDYYMVHGAYSGCSMRAMLLWHSKDLIHWTPMYHIAQQEGIFAHRTSYAWAPELVHHHDMWYLYNYGIGVGVYVMTCADIQKGEWSAPILFPDVVGIDPGHIVDTDGKRYLCVSKNILYPLSDDGLSTTGPGIVIADNCPIDDSVDIEGMCTESPKLLYHNGYFYLTVAQGGTFGPPTSHGIFSLRSKELKGPYERSPYNPVCHTQSRSEAWWSRGHGTLIDTPDGRWYMVYHGIAHEYPCFGRMCLLEPVEWTEDGWFTMPLGAAAGFPQPLPLQAVPCGAIDHSLFWNAPDSSILNRVTITDQTIDIQCEGSTERDSMPLIYTQSYFNYEVSVHMTVSGENASGALSLYSSKKCQYGLTWNNGKLYIHNGGRDWYTQNAVSFPDASMYLKLRLADGVASAWYSEDGEHYRKLNYCADVSCWCANSGTGASIQPALIAMGDGSVRFEQFTLLPCEP